MSGPTSVCCGAPIMMYWIHDSETREFDEWATCQQCFMPCDYESESERRARLRVQSVLPTEAR